MNFCQHFFTDIDECVKMEDGKSKVCEKDHETCVNTPGSFRCECEAGFVRNENKEICEKQKSEGKPFILKLSFRNSWVNPWGRHNPQKHSHLSTMPNCGFMCQKCQKSLLRKNSSQILGTYFCYGRIKLNKHDIQKSIIRFL